MHISFAGDTTMCTGTERGIHGLIIILDLVVKEDHKLSLCQPCNMAVRKADMILGCNWYKEDSENSELV